MMKFFAPAVVGLILISSCASTNTLTMSVNQPARVFLPAHIDSVAILDRTAFQKKDDEFEKIDKLLTIEGKELDRDGAFQYADGMSNYFLNTNRFLFSSVCDSTTVVNSANNSGFLAWDDIRAICEESNVEAIFVLENYDTDGKVNYTNKTKNVNGPLGVQIPTIEHTVTITTDVNTTTRLYIPATQSILDEYKDTERFLTVGRGINPAKAAEAIKSRKGDVNRVSYAMGEAFANRYLINRIRVTRNYYVRGTDNFEIGKRRAQTGDWDGAGEMWERDLDHPKAKIAGRAHYNMAILAEINGDLETALAFASKAYTDYEDKLALSYIRILKNRQQDALEMM